MVIKNKNVYVATSSFKGTLILNVNGVQHSLKQGVKLNFELTDAAFKKLNYSKKYLTIVKGEKSESEPKEQEKNETTNDDVSEEVKEIEPVAEIVTEEVPEVVEVTEIVTEEVPEVSEVEETPVKKPVRRGRKKKSVKIETEENE